MRRDEDRAEVAEYVDERFRRYDAPGHATSPRMPAREAEAIDVVAVTPRQRRRARVCVRLPMSASGC